MYDLSALSMHLREVLLKESLELPEKDFLRLAAHIFDSKQNDLIPLLVSLLQNLQLPPRSPSSSSSRKTRRSL